MHIYFHIGAGKTGSSAIQHALATNQAELLNQGVYIPSENLTDGGKVTGYHVWWFENIKQMQPENASEELYSKIAYSIEHAEKKGCSKILFSAENLSNEFAWADMLRDVLSGHEITVCIYIRRQDDYLLSAWQQWGIKTGNNLNEWLYKHVGTSGDWSVPIKEWQKIATNKLQVRVYQRERLQNNDVVDDFFSVLNIDTAEITKSKSNVNTSFNVAVEELALAAPGLFDGPHDNKFYNMVQKYSTKAHKKERGESRLTASERVSLISRYEESNQWIKNEYIKDHEGPLFNVPKESDYHVLTSDEIELKKWALITELVYGMHQKNQ